MPRKSQKAASISFEQFTEVTTAALLRALEVRKLPRGPILIGIVYYPEGIGPGGRGGQVVGPGAVRFAKRG